MTLDLLYEILEKKINGTEILDYAAGYRPYPLQLSFSACNEGVRYLQKLYQDFGLETQVLEFPADGKTVYADRHFPLAWDITEGWAEVDGFKIADYSQNSYSVVPFSGDSGGICQKTLLPVADLPPEGSLADYAALLVDFPSQEEINALLQRGCPAFFAAVDLEPVHDSLDNSRRWYNDLFGSGQIDQRHKTCAGFSISPALARQLLAQYRAKGALQVLYLLKSRAYAGKVTAITSVIAGEDEQRSFLVSAHAYEPHATNNISGVAMSLAAAKALQELITAGVLARPKHSIRFFHGLENFGIYAWGQQNPDQMKAAVGGLSVDSFGRASFADKKEQFVLRRCLNVHPSAQHGLAREVLARVCAARGIDFTVREDSSNNEELMQDPQFGPAWNLLYGSLWAEPYQTRPRGYFYHTDVDTVDHLSPEMLSAAAVFTATTAYYAANAGDMAQMAAQDWQRIVQEKCREALRLQDKDPDLRHLRAQRLAAWYKLSEKSALAAIGDAQLAADFLPVARQKVAAALALLSDQEPGRINQPAGYSDIIARLVPGPLGLGTISAEHRRQAAKVLGHYSLEYWSLDRSGANLYLFDGKRSVFDVACAAWATREYTEHEEKDGLARELEKFAGLARIMMDSGLAEKKTIVTVTKTDILAGLHRLGVVPGDKLMVHASLKSLGHVAGGPDAVLDALQEAVSWQGILAMPAFTDCADGSGREPFDKATAAVETWIGLIPETFRQRGKVLRCGHPTHSVLAYGQNAANFLDQQDPYDCFAKDGPWGKLAQNGKILFIGETVGGNSFLHACEAWFTDYLLETYAWLKKDGSSAMVRVTNYPYGCRGGWYKQGRRARYYRLLQERGIFQETTVGQARLTLCRAGDLAAAMQEILREDPFILLHKSGCTECAQFRAKGRAGQQS